MAIACTLRDLLVEVVALPPPGLNGYFFCITVARLGLFAVFGCATYPPILLSYDPG